MLCCNCLCQDLVAELDNLGAVIPGAEIIIAYLALDSLLAVIAGIEALTDMVVIMDDSGPRPKRE